MIGRPSPPFLSSVQTIGESLHAHVPPHVGDQFERPHPRRVVEHVRRQRQLVRPVTLDESLDTACHRRRCADHGTCECPDRHRPVPPAY